MIITFGFLLLLLRPCISQDISVTVYASTLFEVDGISSIPSVFGITAYNGTQDFSSDSGTRFLAAHNIDTVGLGTTLNSLLPTADYPLPISSLEDWFSLSNAYIRYRNTPDYYTLRSRHIWKGGAKPFLFIRNVHGICMPYCQKVNCWNEGGTPKAFDNQYDTEGFEWWTTLITGYLKLALEADPNIDTVHIWNEPDQTFWMDGKNGSHYAKFYMATAQAIKSLWPNIRIGGPVSSLPSTAPLSSRKHSALLWYTYIKPLIDSTVPLYLLDFVDFHAFDDNTNPEALLNAIETTVSYALVKHNVFLPIAITESNINLSGDYSNNKQSYFLNRTFPLMISTFALLRTPNKVFHRLLFDYKGTSKCKGCKFANGSPESFMYKLLGKLVNGSRLHLVIEGGEYMTSNCYCNTSKSLGGQPIVGEAAVVNRNITFALLNTCNCPLTIKLSLVGLTNSIVQSCWAAIQDYSGVSVVTPLSWSSSTQSLILPSYSLYVSTYQFSTRYSSSPSTSPFSSATLFNRHHTQSKNHLLTTTKLLLFKRSPLAVTKSHANHKTKYNRHRFPIRLDYVQQAISSYPSKSKYIMMAIPSPVTCSYYFSVDYSVEHALYYNPMQVKLKLGFIGSPGSINWTVSYKCSQYYNSISARKWLQVTTPGQYYEEYLSCVPKVRSNGYVRLHFKSTSTCQDSSRKINISNSSSSVGYLAFTSLVYISQMTLNY